MFVLDQADASGEHVFADGHGAGDIDVAEDGDAARCGEMGLAAGGQDGQQALGDAVVLDDGTVAVGAAVQAFAVAVGRDQIREQACQRHALGEVAGWAQQHHLLADGGRVPLAVGSGAQVQPGAPGGGDVAAFHLDARRLHLDRFDGTEADDVFEQAGEVGNVHAADAEARARVAHGAEPVARAATG